MKGAGALRIEGTAKSTSRVVYLVETEGQSGDAVIYMPATRVCRQGGVHWARDARHLGGSRAAIIAKQASKLGCLRTGPGP